MGAIPVGSVAQETTGTGCQKSCGCRGCGSQRRDDISCTGGKGRRTGTTVHDDNITKSTRSEWQINCTGSTGSNKRELSCNSNCTSDSGSYVGRSEAENGIQRETTDFRRTGRRGIVNWKKIVAGRGRDT